MAENRFQFLEERENLLGLIVWKISCVLRNEESKVFGSYGTIMVVKAGGRHFLYDGLTDLAYSHRYGEFLFYLVT